MSYFGQLGLAHAGTGYSGGWRNGDVAEGGESDYYAPLLDDNEPVELQRFIDDGAELEEYQDDIEDRTFWRRGQW